jgi:tryptophan 2,3-dioxygenase
MRFNRFGCEWFGPPPEIALYKLSILTIFVAGPPSLFPPSYLTPLFMSPSPTQEDFSPAVLAQLHRLQEKYAPDGQDLAAYLEGLYHAKYINYWDYIKLDTLLSLQRPLTNIPDERIFIMYHQISELYFKLCLCEYEQIGNLPQPTLSEVVLRLGRINRYFDNLIDSFDVMVDGMDKQQFLDFRMALMPASGFQSVQYRMIEIASTSLENLTDEAKRQALGKASAYDYDELLGCIYWKAGATVEASGAKALTLIEFERKYTADLVRHAEAYHHRNVWAVVQRLPAEERQHPRLLRALRQLDISVNVNWPLMHFKSAVRYLQRNPTDVAATGGTNWRSYLPPKFQRRIFYPQLWSAQELEEWGKGWVDSVLEETVGA